jgi:hypothetical protein
MVRISARSFAIVPVVFRRTNALKHIKTASTRFLHHPFRFIIRMNTSIRCCINNANEKASLNEPRINGSVEMDPLFVLFFCDFLQVYAYPSASHRSHTRRKFCEANTRFGTWIYSSPREIRSNYTVLFIQ